MKTAFFLDIDDCLIETSRLGIAELTTLKASLASQGIKKNTEVTREFELSFHRVYDSHQGKTLKKGEQEQLDKYLYRLKELQTNIIREYGQVKKWSRECFLYISAEKFGVHLDSAQIKKATFDLWKSITDHNPFYHDSLRFLKKLMSESIPFYLISASDSRLQFDDSNHQFIYDPEYSRNLKLQRLRKFIDLGIPSGNIFTGDPYDKPNPWVFRQAFEKARKDVGEGFESVMVGDSVNNDLVPAAKLGMEKLVLVNRHGGKADTNKGINYAQIRNFDELTF